MWKKDRIRNGHVRESLKVAPVTKKIIEKRLNWYPDMLRDGTRARAEKNIRCTSRQERDRKPSGKTRVKEIWKVYG